MKRLTEYNRVSGYLNKIFSDLNKTYFENALSKPVITIQSTPRAYGHVTCGKVWESEEENRHELNIGAGTLRRPIEEIVSTMLHEMVHLYCMENGIKDTSRGTVYHNKKFKEEAEKRDLKIEHHDRYGWTITTPTDSLVNWCILHDLSEIKVTRHDFSGFSLPPVGGGEKAGDSDDTAPATPRKKSSTRKLVCPCCGASVRATRKIRVICGECYDKTEETHYMEEQG